MALAQQLKAFYDGTLRSSGAQYFGETPSTLSAAGLDALPLAFTTTDFRKSAKGKHNVPRRAWNNLNTSLENALFAFVGGDRVGNVKFSLKEDRRGRKLTEEQVAYFKDSRVVAENGALKAVYHATWNDAFTVFDRERLGENTDGNSSVELLAQTAKIGFWFNEKDLTGSTGSRAEKGYLNMENPYEAYSLDDLASAMEKDSGGDGSVFSEWRHQNR